MTASCLEIGIVCWWWSLLGGGWGVSYWDVEGWLLGVLNIGVKCKGLSVDQITSPNKREKELQ